ncbi:hypothetical protein HCH_07033 [Hahella chejuensis KCTC 2396]|uniref:Uncharacterized protein n=1 Tax=Hahella chejuensis (strain KCTC 2396) TaxID=349521 RepID=Q2S6S6_HAHCH|nr:hypothetical protein HCH_07033 [Hahella chejuensis KCTC 2396]
MEIQSITEFFPVEADCLDFLTHSRIGPYGLNDQFIV